MGADIHGVVQTRWKGDSAWRNEVEIDDDRSYLRFSILAGVRNYNDITPISEPRGLPEDSGVVDECVNMYYGVRQSIWLGDHSHSWLTPAEILEWDGWGQQYDDEGTYGDYCRGFLHFIAWVNSRYSGLNREIRLIFGFDS